MFKKLSNYFDGSWCTGMCYAYIYIYMNKVYGVVFPF